MPSRIGMMTRRSAVRSHRGECPCPSLPSTRATTVNRLGDPNFMLWLDELEEGAPPPASARLRKDLRRWLAELDPDAPWDADAAPRRRWEHDGWAVTFRAV